MDFERFLISLFVFLFVVFLTPGLIDSVGSVSPAEPLFPVLQVVPVLFLTVVGLFPLYFGLKEA